MGYSVGVNARAKATERYPEGTPVQRYSWEADGKAVMQTGKIGKPHFGTHATGQDYEGRWVIWANGKSRVYTLNDLDRGNDGLVA